MDDNDSYHINKKLDAEFRRILRIIKPYIPCIMNNDFLTSYRLWLEKLSDVGPNEKQERNRYVMELCYQIQDGILEYPFTQLPKDGPLPPFTPEYHNNQVERKEDSANFYSRFSSSQQENQNYSTNAFYNDMKNIQQQQQMPNELINTPTMHFETDQAPLANNARSYSNTPDSSIPKQRTLHTVSRTNNSPLSPNMQKLIKHYITPVSSPPTKPSYQNTPTSEKYMYTISPRVQQIVENAKKQFLNNKERVDDEGSWCDITDMSGSTATKLESAESNPSPKVTTPTPTYEESQEQYENKIAELMKIITDLQKQNLKLSENVITYEHAITMKNTNAETSIHNLVGEVNSLKSRLQELRDIKAALKNSQNAACNQWQNTINTLTEELDLAQRQNEALRNEVDALEKQLTEVTNQKKKESMLHKQKADALQKKEMESVQETHFKQIKDLEDKFMNQLNKLKLEYEHKVLDLQTGYQKIIQDKDNEIYRLERLIEVQCKRMHDEVATIRTQMEQTREAETETGSEKILFLQRCIAKMDKLFKKSERNFIKQIGKLKNEIEMKDKVIHIQLSSQRAELIANSNTERQMELDSTIVQLEERYRRLLESQQNYFVNEKKHDTALISELRAVVAQHNIDSSL